MERLFAPWRMEFIEKHDSSKGCVFCDILQNKLSDTKNLILYRGRWNFVMMNKFPYSNGHLMLIPYRHESQWTQLSEEEGMEMHTLTQTALRTLEKVLKPQGFNLGVNLGRASGAGIEQHVHQHMVPRWVGDINFMPLFAEVKIISEHLEATYRKIQEGWSEVHASC